MTTTLIPDLLGAYRAARAVQDRAAGGAAQMLIPKVVRTSQGELIPLQPAPRAAEEFAWEARAADLEARALLAVAQGQATR